MHDVTTDLICACISGNWGPAAAAGHPTLLPVDPPNPPAKLLGLVSQLESSM